MTPVRNAITITLPFCGHFTQFSQPQSTYQSRVGKRYSRRECISNYHGHVHRAPTITTPTYFIFLTITINVRWLRMGWNALANVAKVPVLRDASAKRTERENADHAPEAYTRHREEIVGAQILQNLIGWMTRVTESCHRKHENFGHTDDVRGSLASQIHSALPLPPIRMDAANISTEQMNCFVPDGRRTE